MRRCPNGWTTSASEPGYLMEEGRDSQVLLQICFFSCSVLFPKRKSHCTETQSVLHLNLTESSGQKQQFNCKWTTLCFNMSFWSHYWLHSSWSENDSILDRLVLLKPHFHNAIQAVSSQLWDQGFCLCSVLTHWRFRCLNFPFSSEPEVRRKWPSCEYGPFQ